MVGLVGLAGGAGPLASPQVPSAQTPPPPPGWYPEPMGSGRDRWWTGTEWSALHARNPNSALDLSLVGYTRAMRPAMSRDARIAKWTDFAGFLLGLLSFLASGFLRAAESMSSGIAAGLLTGFVLGLLLDIVAVVFGLRGIGGAPRLGGLGAASYGLAVGGLFGLVTLLLAAVWFVLPV